MKWTECTPENKAYTGRFDAAARIVRKELGAYDTIAHLIFAKTGEAFAGVSVRRWLVNRSMPVHIACTLIDLMEEKKGESLDIEVADFFPYLSGYFDGDFLR